MAQARLLWLGVFHGMSAIVAASAVREPSSLATAEPSAAAVADQLTRGARLYALGCATARCHGSRGEGIRSGQAFRVWPLVGADFRVRNPNAQVIFDVVRSGSEQSLRAMTDRQIYDAIAYQLSLNGARPTTVLTRHNAATALSGPAARASGQGELRPPAGNVVFLHPTAASRAPSNPVANGYLRLRVDQMAQASAIGRHSVAGGGVFSILVLAFQDLTDRPIVLDPGNLRLRASSGARLEPRDIDLEYPIERFHPQTITPGHGTAAVAIFALPAGATPAQLTYDDQTGHPLSVNLAE
jgi:mono/diheme cytochrome c family protein